MKLCRIEGPILAILVGKEKKHFSVHESLICASSLFFKRATSGSWKKTDDHSIKLPEDDPDTFARYSFWLYFGRIPMIREDITEEKPEYKTNKEHYDLVSAWLLGDKLLDTKFQNAALDAILEACAVFYPITGVKYYPGDDVIRHAYDSTIKTAKIRDVLVDMYARVGKADWLPGTDLPKEFLFSLVEELMKIKSKKAYVAPALKASRYYVHNKTNGTSKV
jgi:hypothetical protein